MSLLKIGSNSKLGKSIASFNIPAVKTCPGRTSACEAICYANKGLFKLQSKLHQATLDVTKTDQFVEIITQELKSPKIKAVRIHASGDFYDADYIAKWHDIIKANPLTKFWAYTRSYRIKKLVKPLQKLAKLPNLQLFASTDSEEPVGPKWLRQANLAKAWDDNDDNVKCPNQKNKDITCEKCTYCFKAPGKKTGVTFKEH